MNLSRLMILGLLAERGPMHGHQIRRSAELTNAEVWGGITGGALYAELRRLDAEGLVEAVRAEQMGRRPARTVFEITEEGGLNSSSSVTPHWTSSSGRPIQCRSC
jgi:DNA-binding PadR family transcriptional regulator